MDLTVIYKFQILFSKMKPFITQFVVIKTIFKYLSSQKFNFEKLVQFIKQISKFLTTSHTSDGSHRVVRNVNQTS